MGALWKIPAVALACASAVSFCACSSGYSPDRTGIYVSKSGEIKSAEIETLDNAAFESARYDSESLKTFIETSVKEYNNANYSLDYCYADDTQETLGVRIEAFSYHGSEAELILDYNSISDYLAFNDNAESGGVTDLVVGTVDEAIATGLTFDNMTDAEGTAVSSDEIIANGGNYFAAVTGETYLTVDGSVTYVSSGATVEDGSSVNCPKAATTYVIFK